MTILDETMITTSENELGWTTNDTCKDFPVWFLFHQWILQEHRHMIGHTLAQIWLQIQTWFDENFFGN